MTLRYHPRYIYSGIPSRGREVEEFKDQETWVYSFTYAFEGKPYHVTFERDYQLAPNLVDAVIDNFQIKTHGTILVPVNERAESAL